MSRTLNRTVLAGGVIYPAGTPATDELEKAIANPDYWSGSAAEAEGYDVLTVAELKAEIDKRNAGRDEADHLAKSGTKAELVAALAADDEA